MAFEINEYYNEKIALKTKIEFSWVCLRVCLSFLGMPFKLENTKIKTDGFWIIIPMHFDGTVLTCAKFMQKERERKR